MVRWLIGLVVVTGVVGGALWSERRAPAPSVTSVATAQTPRGQGLAPGGRSSPASGPPSPPPPRGRSPGKPSPARHLITAAPSPPAPVKGAAPSTLGAEAPPPARVRAELAGARAALRAGRWEEAARVARRANLVAPSEAAYAVMVEAWCGAGDAPRARARARQIRGRSARARLDAVCAARGVRLGD